MAHIPNLKEHILDTAKNIAIRKGLSDINVRLIAKESGIAIGTIYNYYPAKGDIIAAVIEDFWKTSFSNIDFAVLKQLDYITALEKVYYQLLKHLNCFKQNWIVQLTLLSATDKSIGRIKEEEYFKKIHSIILIPLEQNENIINQYSPSEIKKLAEFIFENMLRMLKNGEEDFSLFKKLLSKIIG